VIYPEQFGAEAVVPTTGDAINANVESVPSVIWPRLMKQINRLHELKRRILKGKRAPRKIDL
ncbi:MAG: hypothetical protein K2L46_03110, partial [Paramuribaculum sp.]|nr:hypothetical protein [Paramuribaculum sp.]